MKRIQLFAIVIAAALVLPFTAAAQAPHGVKAKIPFKFVAGDKMYPAGEYTIVPTSTNRSLVLQKTDGKEMAVLAAGSARGESAPSSARLVFNTYDNRYFLSQVWDGGHESAFTLPASAREQETARYSRPAQTIVLAQVRN